jgi:hypothetical protein
MIRLNIIRVGIADAMILDLLCWSLILFWEDPEEQIAKPAAAGCAYNLTSAQFPRMDPSQQLTETV